MIDFKKELQKLLDQESEPLPQGELEIFIEAERQLIQSLNKKQTDISMQVEEIYDMVKDADTGVLQEAVRDEKTRVNRIAQTVAGLCDLIDDFYEYAYKSGDGGLEHQAALMKKNADTLIENVAMSRIGEPGQQLNHEIHSVQAAVPSPAPMEQVTKVVRSGYRHMGAIMRKAAVIISKGTEEPDNWAE